MRRNAFLSVGLFALTACHQAHARTPATPLPSFAVSTPAAGAYVEPEAAATLRFAVPSPALSAYMPAYAEAPSLAGIRTYQTNCSACHGASGQGIPGLTTALTSSNIRNDPAALIEVVKFGRKTSPPMPGFSGTLSAADIASVVNYVGTFGGRKPALARVTAADVNSIKR
jgi:cytochrome c5